MNGRPQAHETPTGQEGLAGSHAYGASPIKRRRASASEMEARRNSLYEIVADMEPMAVRQVFYQATVKGIVEKTEAGYGKVQRALVEMRECGDLPFHWIADNTRWQRKPATFQSPEEALRETARFYRKSLWADAEEYVEVWLEKDALSAVVYDVTDDFDVPLMVSRGYSSITFLHQAAADIFEIDRPAYIYHLGDHDPSGVDAANKIEESLRKYAYGAEIHFQRLAVLPHQIEEWGLPTRPTKRTDSRAKRFGLDKASVELDAIDPHRLRNIVRQAIELHLPPDQFRVLKVAEESERELLASWSSAKSGGAK